VEKITLDQFMTLASAEGLVLSAEEAARILPLVQGHRALMQSVREALPADVEPITPAPT
jgi:hypothetical protein